jgi:hypothetical protein
MKEVKTGTYIYNGDTYNFNFYTDLTCAKELEFVNSVVGILVDDNYYNSVIRDLIFDFYIIDIMTDIDTTELENSDTFLNDVEQFLEDTNIVEIVKANMSASLLYGLNDGVDKSIQYLTGVRPDHLNDALASLISTIEKKIGEINLNDVTDMLQKFSGMGKDFTMENLVNTYMNSDIHKKNLEEVEKSKNNRAEFAKDMDKAIKLVKNDNTK